MSFRDEFGQWDPKNQRPELWDLYNARTHKARTSRVPDLELDGNGCLAVHRARKLELPSIYFAHTRPVVIRQGAIVPVNVPLAGGGVTNLPKPGEAIVVYAGAFPHRRRHLVHLRRSRRMPTPSTRSCWKPPQPPSPNAVRPASMTRRPRLRWNNARKRVISMSARKPASSKAPH